MTTTFAHTILSSTCNRIYWSIWSCYTSATVVFALRKWVYSAGSNTLIVRWIKQVTILTVTGHRALSVGHVTVEAIHFCLYVPNWTSGNRIQKASWIESDTCVIHKNTIQIKGKDTFSLKWFIILKSACSKTCAFSRVDIIRVSWSRCATLILGILSKV